MTWFRVELRKATVMAGTTYTLDFILPHDSILRSITRGGWCSGTMPTLYFYVYDVPYASAGNIHIIYYGTQDGTGLSNVQYDVPMLAGVKSCRITNSNGAGNWDHGTLILSFETFS